MAELELTDVECRYGDTVAVRDCSLHVRSGELVTLLGPSGSGKTTLLRAIGGYVRPYGGAIRVDGQDVTRLPPQRRNMGMVFQNYALFPHMTVFANVAFGLRVRGTGRQETARRAREALDMVQLAHREKAHPHQLSGGQQQRVALARAIVIRPWLLLMDEPLGALDLKLRESMQTEIRRIQREVGITTLYVTHDQSEAFAMSDRIVVMDDGRIVEVGTPADLYHKPRTRFAAEFVGQASILQASVLSWNGSTGSVLPTGWPDVVDVEGASRPAGSEVYLLLRPEHVTVAAMPFERSHQARVVTARYTGNGSLLTIAVGDSKMLAFDQRSSFGEGDELYVGWAPSDAHILSEP